MSVRNLSQRSHQTKDESTSSGLRTSTLTKNRTVTLEQIVELYNTLSPSCGGRKEDYFGVAYISNRFNLRPDQVISNVAIGGTEYGIDGYYYDKPNSAFYLFTFRWSENHMSFKHPLDKLGNEGIDKIFVDTSKSSDDPPMITFLKADLFENWKNTDKIIINFVFNGDPIDAEQSKVLSFIRETVEDKRGTIEGYFSRIDQAERIHDVIFQYVSNQRSLGHTTSSRNSIEYAIELGETLKLSGEHNQMMVAMLPLSELHQIYNDLGERFFEKNIRSGLDDGSMTNHHIKKSLRQILTGEEPFENFALYHNGITLTAQRLEFDGAQLHMVEPRILNGAQTIKILHQFVDGYDEAMKKENAGTIRDDLSRIKVMTRIIKSSDDDFLKKVTINNNRQNPIMPWNLRANDLIQVGFEELFGRLGIYYERRENAYKNLTDEDLEAVGMEKGVIEIRKLAQTLLAMQGQIDRISEIKEVFENEIWYSETFKERYLEVDPRILVLLYKIQFRLPSVIREIRNVGIEKYSYISKAKNLLWCLSIHGLMNDSKFAKYIEYYGNTAGIEAGITEILKTMATSKLRFILSDAFDRKKYQNNISEGKISFLRSKAAANDCIEAARARFGWQKLNL